MEGNAILSVQPLQLSEFAELRWDGATELIRVEVTERATVMQCKIEDASDPQIIIIISNQR